jgi:hypothetical protein
MQIRHHPMCWVVFETPIHVRGHRLTAVCEQEEWDTMEPVLRQNYVLIRSAIANEGEAERLARSCTTFGKKHHLARSA